MILRGLISMGVVASLAGLLFSAPPQSAPMIPASVERTEAADDDFDPSLFVKRVHEHLEQFHQHLNELRERGRHDEAERYMHEWAERVGMAEEVVRFAEEAHRELEELHETGHVEEARRLFDRASQHLQHMHGELSRLMHEPPHAKHREHAERGELATIHERLQGVAHQAMELLEEGRRERAHELLGRAHEHVEQLLERLHDEGRIDEASRLREHAQHLMHEIQQHARELHVVHEDEDWMRRLHHLHAAAESLSAAGMEREAQDLLRRAEEMHEQMEAQRRLHAEGPEPHDAAIERVMGELHALRREVQELKELVLELHHRLDRVERFE